MSRAREQILSRVYAAARPEPAPVPWQSRRRFDDLAARFTQTLTDGGGRVVRAESLDDTAAKLGDLLKELGARRVIANDEPPLDRLDPAVRWPDYEWHIAGKSGGDLRAFCAAADVGLSGAAAAFAETGTVVMACGTGQSRAATLLPPVHIALVSTARLVADIFAWAAARAGDMPAAVTFVSGPSKTADIEQTLAIGVHGPGRFIVVLYDG
ncbi:MAG: lactate utilization protein [Anaerolineae bacterium]|nr:lactate utilization protein [Anaerolineae bacterium]